MSIDTGISTRNISLVWSCRSQIPLHGPTDFVCDPTRPTDKNPYMSRLIRHVYDKTKSADLSETRSDFSEQTWSPTKSGRVRLVEFGDYQFVDIENGNTHDIWANKSSHNSILRTSAAPGPGFVGVGGNLLLTTSSYDWSDSDI